MNAVVGVVLGGTLGVALLAGGAWALRGVASATPTARDSRPSCVQALGPEFRELDVRDGEEDRTGRTYFVGVDRSPSNRELAAEQLDAAVRFVGSLPATDAASILFITDRSERSSTPDLPELPRHPGGAVEVPALPCGTCEAASLFEQKCREQLSHALVERAAERRAQLRGEARQAKAERFEIVKAWQARVEDWWPRPGTSILGFWRKVADTPVVRRTPQEVTVVLLGDLEEARTRSRRDLERYAAAVRRGGGQCLGGNPIPSAVAGVEVVLLQTMVDGVDARRWAEIWETALVCAGARAVRYRYSSGAQLRPYLELEAAPTKL